MMLQPNQHRLRFCYHTAESVDVFAHAKTYMTRFCLEHRLVLVDSQPCIVHNCWYFIVEGTLPARMPVYIKREEPK